MIHSETFTIGTGPGEYPDGNSILDKLFDGSSLVEFRLNKVNCDEEDGTISNGRLNKTVGTFNTGDKIIAYVKK